MSFLAKYNVGWWEKWKWKVAQSCPTLCDPLDCSLSRFSIHGIFQARVLEWVAISFSWGSSRPRDWPWVSHIVSRRFTIWATSGKHPRISHDSDCGTNQGRTRWTVSVALRSRGCFCLDHPPHCALAWSCFPGGQFFSFWGHSCCPWNPENTNPHASPPALPQ